MTSSTAERLPAEPVDVLAEIRRLLAEDAAAPPAVAVAPVPSPRPARAISGLPPAGWDAAPVGGVEETGSAEDEDWPPRLPDLETDPPAEGGRAVDAEAVADRLWQVTAQETGSVDALASGQAKALSAPPALSQPSFGHPSNGHALDDGFSGDGSGAGPYSGDAGDPLREDAVDVGAPRAASGIAFADDPAPEAAPDGADPAADSHRPPRASAPGFLPPLLLGAEARVEGGEPQAAAPSDNGIPVLDTGDDRTAEEQVHDRVPTIVFRRPRPAEDRAANTMPVRTDVQAPALGDQTEAAEALTDQAADDQVSFRNPADDAAEDMADRVVGVPPMGLVASLDPALEVIKADVDPPGAMDQLAPDAGSLADHPSAEMDDPASEDACLINHDPTRPSAPAARDFLMIPVRGAQDQIASDPHPAVGNVEPGTFNGAGDGGAGTAPIQPDVSAMNADETTALLRRLVREEIARVFSVLTGATSPDQPGSP